PVQEGRLEELLLAVVQEPGSVRQLVQPSAAPAAPPLGRHTGLRRPRAAAARAARAIHLPQPPPAAPGRVARSQKPPSGRTCQPVSRRFCGARYSRLVLRTMYETA